MSLLLTADLSKNQHLLREYRLEAFDLRTEPIFVLDFAVGSKYTDTHKAKFS